MIFFEPKELLGLAEGDRGFSFARLMFAERREGFDGNGAAYRWVSRLLNPQTKLTDKNTTKLMELISGKIVGGKRPFAASCTGVGDAQVSDSQRPALT